MAGSVSTQKKALREDEQRILLSALPDHPARICLFKVYTGCREQEVYRLSWEWEGGVPVLDTSGFIIPGSGVKNGEDRLVVLKQKTGIEASR